MGKHSNFFFRIGGAFSSLSFFWACEQVGEMFFGLSSFEFTVVVLLTTQGDGKYVVVGKYGAFPVIHSDSAQLFKSDINFNCFLSMR